MGLTATQRPGRAPPASGLPPVFRRDAFYQTGTADPHHGADAGAGLWKSKPVTAAAVAQKAAILSILGIPTSIYPGRNATAHMLHYLYNSGERFEIDLEDMIASVPNARLALVAEFRQAQRFIQTLPPGTHHFTSRTAESAYNYQGESADWFFAIGGYSYWGKGVAHISSGKSGLRYEVDFEYHFFDRYNWDGGKVVNIGDIVVTDEFMGEFHLQGLAREFDCFGRIKRHVAWEGPAAVPGDRAILRRQGR